MKKMFFVFGLVVFLSAFGAEYQEISASFPNYSKVYLQKYRNNTSKLLLPSPSKQSIKTVAPSYKSWPKKMTVAKSDSLNVIASVQPTELNKNINEITGDPISIFNLSFRAIGEKTPAKAPSAAVIKTMQFQITDNSGIIGNFSNFSLVVADDEKFSENFVFERNGFLTLSFENFRLARGENKNLDIKIKIDDPDNFPALPGRFRIKLDKITAIKENTVVNIPVSLGGRIVSDYVTLNPTPTVSGGGESIAQFSSQQIYGRMLGSEESAFVLNARLKANYDDFLLQEVSASNVYGAAVDSWINKVNLINIQTHQILASQKFVNGKVHFKLGKNAVTIPRNTELQLGFQVVVGSSVSQNVTENRLKLNITPADIVLYGFGSGQAVPDNQKHLNLNTDTFFLARNGGVFLQNSDIQPPFVSTGSKNGVYRFIVRNNGKKAISLGRVSFNIYPSGVEFFEGISPDDAEIREIYQGEVARSSLFTTIIASGNTFTFDANQDFYIDGQSSKEFILNLALSDIGANEKSDSVGVQILGDVSFIRGGLAIVKNSGAHFIWSDQSGRPHTESSNDWFSGYLIQGLPSNTIVIKRGN